MPECRRREARGERVVHVDDGELEAAEQAVERPADVHGQRRRPWPRPARKRKSATDAQHRGVSLPAVRPTKARLALLAAMAGLLAFAATAAAAPQVGLYVALGDSYTAGPLI